MKSLPALSLICALAACSPQIGQDYQSAGEPPSAAAAEPVEEPKASREELLKMCSGWASLARNVMDARQAGVPMRKLLDSLNEEGENEITTKIVMKAYDSPAFRTEGHQQREITEFENSVYSDCLKGIERR